MITTDHKHLVLLRSRIEPWRGNVRLQQESLNSALPERAVERGTVAPVTCEPQDDPRPALANRVACKCRTLILPTVSFDFPERAILNASSCRTAARSAFKFTNGVALRGAESQQVRLQVCSVSRELTALQVGRLGVRRHRARQPIAEWRGHDTEPRPKPLDRLVKVLLVIDVEHEVCARGVSHSPG
jgi:hypothetical protein